MASEASGLRGSAELIECHINALAAVMDRCDGTPNDTDLLFTVSAARLSILHMINTLGLFHTLPVTTDELMEQDRQAEYLLNELVCDDGRSQDERLRERARLWVQQLQSHMEPVRQLITQADDWDQHKD